MYGQQLFGGFSATVDFKDAGGTLLGSIAVSATGPNQRTFAGWTDVGGIASVEITSAVPIHPAVIDDHMYGLDQAFASEVQSFGSGCNRTFASFYENHGAFDLSNTSLAFSPVGANYVVLPGTSPVVAPIAQPSLINGVSALSLGWTFPYPGGTTTQLYVGRRGFVRFT